MGSLETTPGRDDHPDRPVEVAAPAEVPKETAGQNVERTSTEGLGTAISQSEQSDSADIDFEAYNPKRPRGERPAEVEVVIEGGKARVIDPASPGPLKAERGDEVYEADLFGNRVFDKDKGSRAERALEEVTQSIGDWTDASKEVGKAVDEIQFDRKPPPRAYTECRPDYPPYAREQHPQHLDIDGGSAAQAAFVVAYLAAAGYVKIRETMAERKASNNASNG